MAHRLIASMRRVDRILMNGLLTGYFNKLAQVEPRYSNFRQFLSQSSIYFSHDPRKTFDEPIRPNRGSNSGGNRMKKNKSTGRIRFDKRTNNLSATSPTKSAPRALNQSSNLVGHGGVTWYRNQKSPPPIVDELVFLVLFTFLIPILLFVNMCLHYHKKEITWKDFANYLAQGRVAKVEVINQNFLKVHTAPGTSTEDTILWVRIDSLDSHKISALPAETLENAGNGMEAEPENGMEAETENDLIPGYWT